jgi:hypothetical protein
MFACVRAELSSVTLFRDESGRDFDKSNAITYMRMLRLVAAHPVVKIDKIILVAHDPEILPLCDSVIGLVAMKDNESDAVWTQATFASVLLDGELNDDLQRFALLWRFAEARRLSIPLRTIRRYRGSGCRSTCRSGHLST